MNTELRPIHPLTGSNKHGKSAIDKQISDFVKLTQASNFRSGSTLWSKKKYMLQELNMAKQGMAWSYSKSLTKVS